MKASDIARIILFYLLIAIIVLFAPFGPVFSYVLIIGLSLIFILATRLRIVNGSLLAGLIAGTAAMIAVFLIIYVAGGVQVLGLRTSDAAMVLLWGAVMQVFVATGEELSFRQYLFADLDRLGNRTVAAALSSAGFMVLHIPSMILLQASLTESAIALLTIFTAGIVLSLIFLRWGLFAAMGFHFAWNFLQYNVFGLGGRMDSVLETLGSGNSLLNGGIFGPEASLPGLIVIGLTLAVVWYFYRRPERKAGDKQD